MVIANAVTMAHRLIISKLANARLVVDATAGNGKDTLFLAENIPHDAAVWAFDIQQQAIIKSQELLKKHGLEHKVKFILASHATIMSYISQPIDVAMFNLGYLPGGNHSINTRPEVTVEAITQILYLLNIGGIVTIVAYPGYEQGRLECQAVRKYLGSLNQKLFAVACWAMVNQKNNPPVLYIIEKIRSE
ncbi:hypothetical protein SCACP_19250 [Sporomusa carbonis]